MRVITAGGCCGGCGAFLAEGRVLPMGFRKSGLAIEFVVLFDLGSFSSRNNSVKQAVRDAVMIVAGWSLFGPQPTLGLGVRLVLLLGCDTRRLESCRALGYFVTPLVTIKRGIGLVIIISSSSALGITPRTSP